MLIVPSHLKSFRMTTVFRQRVSSAKQHINENIERHKHVEGWILPRQATSFADDGTWTNIDQDVTPLERRTWGSWSILGFWCSDALNAQGWEGPSSIIAAGLTYREAIYLCELSFELFLPQSSLTNSTSAHGSYGRHDSPHVQWSDWRRLPYSLPNRCQIVVRLLFRSFRGHHTNDHGSVLAWHPELDRKHCHVPDDPSYLAFVP